MRPVVLIMTTVAFRGSSSLIRLSTSPCFPPAFHVVKSASGPLRQAVGARRRLREGLRCTSSSSNSATKTNRDEAAPWEHWEHGFWSPHCHSGDKDEGKAVAATPAPPSLTDEEVEKGIALLKPIVGERRRQRFDEVLKWRTKNVRFLFEHPDNPNNVWACLRTLDSFGVQNIDVVANPFANENGRSKGRLRAMSTAVGSQRWLTISGHASTAAAVARLRADGYQIVASDLSDEAVPIEELTWDVPTAVVLGNEQRGISKDMRRLCDATFRIPMRGFAESLNLSVACTVALAHLSQCGGLRPGDLSPAERRRVLLAWLSASVPAAEAVLRRAGLAPLPPQSILGHSSARGRGGGGDGGSGDRASDDCGG